MTTFNREDSLDLPVLAAAPEAPEAGRKKLYVGDDGQFYAIDSQGNVTALQAAGGLVPIVPFVRMVIFDEELPTGTWQQWDLSAYGSKSLAAFQLNITEIDGVEACDIHLRPNNGSEPPPVTIRIQAQETVTAFVLVEIVNGIVECMALGPAARLWGWIDLVGLY